MHQEDKVVNGYLPIRALLLDQTSVSPLYSTIVLCSIVCLNTAADTIHECCFFPFNIDLQEFFKTHDLAFNKQTKFFRLISPHIVHELHVLSGPLLSLGELFQVDNTAAHNKINVLNLISFFIQMSSFTELTFNHAVEDPQQLILHNIFAKAEPSQKECFLKHHIKGLFLQMLLVVKSSDHCEGGLRCRDHRGCAKRVYLIV